jgi:hypothetical protein
MGGDSVIAKTNFDERRKKLQRLALIKERYRKLVLEPKKQILLEIEDEVSPELELEFEPAN